MNVDRCIICNQMHQEMTVEHIVPQSLGNVHYILRKGIICAGCNQRFSRYENRVVSSDVFIEERVKRGLIKPLDNSPELKDQDLLYVILKISYEALYQSRPKIFSQINHQIILDTLYHGKEYPYPLIKNKLIKNSKPIPGLIDRWRLKLLGVSLRYMADRDRVLVEWRYGEISGILSIGYNDFSPAAQVV